MRLFLWIKILLLIKYYVALKWLTRFQLVLLLIRLKKAWWVLNPFRMNLLLFNLLNLRPNHVSRGRISLVCWRDLIGSAGFFFIIVLRIFDYFFGRHCALAVDPLTLNDMLVLIFHDILYSLYFFISHKSKSTGLPRSFISKNSWVLYFSKFDEEFFEFIVVQIVWETAYKNFSKLGTNVIIFFRFAFVLSSCRHRNKFIVLLIFKLFVLNNIDRIFHWILTLEWNVILKSFTTSTFLSFL